MMFTNKEAIPMLKKLALATIAAVALTIATPALYDESKK